MQNFAQQCLDLAQSLLSHNLGAIREDGTIEPLPGETSRPDESGHAAHAIGEYFRATGETTLGEHDLVDLAARCITSQIFEESQADNGIAYTALGLLSFGPAKERNLVWERLVEETREQLDKSLFERNDFKNHWQAFNIAKAVTRFSMGLSKKDETSKLIDSFIDRIAQTSSSGFCDDHPENLGGTFDVYGVMTFVFIRQALQLHANVHLRDRKLPSLRTHAEKYLKMLPDFVRQDGLGWSYGRGIGAYGQMHCISLIMQALRDEWIAPDQGDIYIDLVRRLFQFFYVNYLDLEHGYLVIRDEERDTQDAHTTRMANFDAARYLCQWARLAKTVNQDMTVETYTGRKGGRYISFDRRQKKEQGLFIYQDPTTGAHMSLPLISNGGSPSSDSLPFPHFPGVFDWPVAQYQPIMIPEVTVGNDKIIPAFYGKNCSTGLGMRKSFFFRYEQPELINHEEKMVNGLGSCKVQWSFSDSKITSDFTFRFNKQTQIDAFRYVIALAAPHSLRRLPSSLTMGPESLRVNVVHDDFHANWKEPTVVSHDTHFKTYYGKIHYLQELTREHPLIVRPGQSYRISVEFNPDLLEIGKWEQAV